MDFRDIQRAALDQGWRIEPTKKGVRFVPPDPLKPMVQWHGTPSDVRAIRNFLALLKQQGLIWPWPPQGSKKP
jgi:hypothetical protein